MVGSVTASCFDQAVFVEFVLIILITIPFVEVRARKKATNFSPP